ncbi:MAG: RagB/SusD family nutrient uptake outer membrane protein [Bacteroidales bacterium]|nr:RagB/SusD family nutrient uptake outer membrane protein [Bacteroidales bacterium]
MKKVYIFLACCLALTSCFKDLDQAPVTDSEANASEVYSTVDGYESVLAKIYASYVIAGQELGGGNADLASNNGYDFLRGYFNLQESATEEVANTWLSGEKMEDLTFMSWDSSDPWVADTYYRLYYSIALCNEFLRNAGDISGFTSSEQEQIGQWKAEARFMRALSYYLVLDLFRQGPFVDETMGVGAYSPEALDGEGLFNYVESEILDIEDDLASRSECEYGHASRGAAWTLLAKMYLNAEVYGAGDHYTECITYCNKVIAEGYSLESDYFSLFNADNDKRTNEIILPFVVDATNTVSWGATTYLVCGQVGNSSTQDPAEYGITAGWGMFRVRGELPEMFASADLRGKFYTSGQTQWFTGAIDDQSQGYFCEKWSNLNDDGDASSDTGAAGADIDYPFFRLADVYLMVAEAVLRGGSGASSTDALGYVNDLRERAYGSTDGNISSSQLTLSFILEERARELYFECTRRTDLVRYGLFTASSYLWQWKGGVLDGRAVDEKYNYYPIPAAELSANPNLKNEKY